MEVGSEMQEDSTPEDRILIVTNFQPQNPFVEALIKTIPIPADLCFRDIADKRAENLFSRHVMSLWLAGVVLNKSGHYRNIIICEQFIGCITAFLPAFLFIKNRSTSISLMYNPRRRWLGRIYKIFIDSA
jgi:hypothetical protein